MGRPKVNLDAKEAAQAKKLLLSLLKKQKGKSGNSRLLNRFLDEAQKSLKQNFAEEVYWNVRNELIENGILERGRGKGGTVFLLDFSEKKKPKAPKVKRYRKESDLYHTFHKTIQTEWVQESGISEFVSEITAHKGRKDTGGKWTRPDVTVVAIGNYEFLPGKTVEVITFEIKPGNMFGIQSVYETASHSAFAHQSYLAIHLPAEGGVDESQWPVLLDRIESESVRLGVGLITFENPEDWDTYEVKVEPQHKTPSPRDTNDFLSRLLNADTKQKLLKAVK